MVYNKWCHSTVCLEHRVSNCKGAMGHYIIVFSEKILNGNFSTGTLCGVED